MSLKLSSKRKKQDKVLEQSRQKHLITAAFLKTLKNNFSHGKAFQLALEGFTNYMVLYYELVLQGTQPGSQERFDRFRRHYKEGARRSSYFRIIESKPDLVRVQYKRCPFSEVMKENDLEDLSYAYCLSDAAFTERLFPGVKFSRKHVIIKGDRYCDHTWIFQGIA